MDIVKSEAGLMTATEAEFMKQWNDSMSEELDNVPMTIPALKIDKDTGELVLSLDKRKFKSVKAIVCSVRNSRIYFAPLGDERQWFCRCAEDSKRVPGRGIVNEKLENSEIAVMRGKGAGGACLRCAYSVWVNDAAPPCRYTYNLYLYIPEERMFVVLRAAKTGIKPTEAYLKSFKVSQQKPNQFFTAISTEKKNSPGKTWFIPVYQRGDALSEEDQIDVMRSFITVSALISKSLQEEPDFSDAPRPVHYDEEGNLTGADEVEVDWMREASDNNIAKAEKSEHMKAMEYMAERGILLEEAKAEWGNVGTLNGIIRKFKALPKK